MLISDSNSINGFFIKYSQLFKMNQIFKFGRWKDCSNLDIFIDMNSTVKELYHNKPPVNGSEEIASSIINLCGHYREYYRRYYGCYTRFFIVYSMNRPKNCVNIFDEYNSKNILMQYSKPVISDMIAKACSYLSDRCPYIPDVFFIYSDYETYTTIYDIIEFRENKPYPSIILTKDVMNYQVVAFSDRTYIARPKKSSITRNVDGKDIRVFEDKSSLLYKSNIIPSIVSNVFKCIMDPNWRSINPVLISLIFSLRGLDKRNIPMLLNTQETLNTIYDGIKFGYILNSYSNDISSIYDNLNIIKFGVSKKDISNRFIMLDMITQFNIMKNELSLSVDNYSNCVVNMHNPDYVKKLNYEVFKYCPIYLDNL